ncbi:MAG: 4-hydroxy-tetrahydrodipicolinate synthase [bacterium]
MQFSGAYTALITPFRNGEVDRTALGELVERQIEGGIDGLVPCGTTGESATMNEAERLDVIRTVVDVANGRVPIIAGTGSNDTIKSTHFTQRVAEIPGVDAALVVVPYYNKPGQRGIIAHFEHVANHGGLPVVMYNVPGRTVVSMTAETISTLAAHPNIVAIKEASADMNLDTDMFARAPMGFSMLSGDDFTTFQFVAMGGHGCISVVSNIAPKLVHELVAATAQANLDTARRLHTRVHQLARVLFSDANPVPTKCAAKLLGWCSDEARLPLYQADGELTARVETALRQAELLK